MIFFFSVLTMKDKISNKLLHKAHDIIILLTLSKLLLTLQLNQNTQAYYH